MDYSIWQDSIYRIGILLFTICAFLVAISFCFGDHDCLVHYRWMELLLQWLFLVRVTVRDRIRRMANQMWRSALKWKDQVCVSSSWLLLPSIPCSKIGLWLHCCPFHPWEALATWTVNGLYIVLTWILEFICDLVFEIASSLAFLSFSFLWLSLF